MTRASLPAGFFRAAGRIAKDLGLNGDGYRILANTGRHGHQEVPHFHLHLFGGQPVEGRAILSTLPDDPDAERLMVRGPRS